MWGLLIVLCCFKQKTAYELRISDWSSDVCSSDLGMARAMADHHKVRILGEALVEAVKLSSRYIAGRQLPDKAVSVLDTACAKIAIGQNSIPADIEDARDRKSVV